MPTARPSKAAWRKRASLARSATCLLGDYVGYGADPDWTVNDRHGPCRQGRRGRARQSRQRDQRSARADECRSAHGRSNGRAASLARRSGRFLAELPLTIHDDDRLYVHSEASNPQGWIYVKSVAEAARSLSADPAQITFCGHIHTPALYSMSATVKMTAFTPTTGVPIQMLPGRRWLAVLGSIGQPRDGNPAASYLMLDTESARSPIAARHTTSRKPRPRIRKKGLPLWLADRLFTGS